MTNNIKKIIWLASYPKSGNTWFRAFLSALLDDGDVDINEMKINDIFSSKATLEYHTDLDSTNLYDEEIKNLQPEVFTEATLCCQNEHLFVKIHDAYISNKNRLPIVPTVATKCALYFIRNPLDIVGSFANHSGSTIVEALAFMNNPLACLKEQTQFKQLLLDWSGHVSSWTANLPFPVMVIRYEDLLTDAHGTFKKAIEFIGLKVKDETLTQSIKASSFHKLKEKEEKNGFREMRTKNESFFRSGSMENWINELTEEQVKSITDQHQLIMNIYNYKIL